MSQYRNAYRDSTVVAPFGDEAQETSSLTFVDVPDMAITNLQTGRPHLVIVSLRFNSLDSTDYATFQLADSGGNTILDFFSFEPGGQYQVAREWMHRTFYIVVTPTTEVIKLQFRGGNAGDVTRLGHGTMVAVDIGELVENTDYFTSENTATDTLDVTGVSGPSTVIRNTHTFTPATAGDYLILANLWLNASLQRNGTFHECRILVDSVQEDIDRLEPEDAADQRLLCAAMVMNLDATSHTIELEAGMVGAQLNLMDVIRTQLTVIRLDSFPAHSFAYTAASLTLTDRARAGPPEVDYADNIQTLTHTVAGDGEVRAHLVLAFLSNFGSSSADLYWRMQINDLPVNNNQENFNAQQEYSIWDPADQMHLSYVTIHEDDTDFTVDCDGSSKAGTGTLSTVQRRAIVVIDLGPAPSAANNCLSDDVDTTPGVSGVEGGLGSPVEWAQDPMVFELFLFRKALNDAFTYAEFGNGPLGTLLEVRSLGTGSDLEITGLSNLMNSFTLTLLGAMPVVNEWYHLVIRKEGGPGVFAAYCGRMGTDRFGAVALPAADVFPTGYVSDVSASIDASTALEALGISPGGTVFPTSYRIGGPFGAAPPAADYMNGGACEFRSWHVALSDAQIEANKTQFVRWTEAATSPEDRLHLSWRLNEAAPSGGVDRFTFVDSGWRNVVHDTYDGGGATPGHPFAGEAASPIQQLAMQSDGVATVAMDLRVTRFLSMDLDGVATVAMPLTPVRPLAMDTDATSLLEAALDVIRVLAMQSDGVGSLDATLNITINLSASFDGAATLGVNLEIIRDLDVAIDATAAMTADLTIIIEALAMDVDATSAMTADLTMVRALAMQSDGVAAMTGDLIREGTMLLDLDGVGSMTASLTIIKPLSVQFDGVATFSSEFVIPLAMQSDGVATAAFALIRETFLDMAADATSLLTADLLMVRPLAMDLDGTSTLEAALEVLRSLVMQSDGVAALSADLTMTRALAMATVGTSSLAAALTFTRLVAMAPTGVGTLDADLTIQPVGGAGVVFDSEQFDMFEQQRTPASSAHPHVIHGQFVIPSGFNPNDTIRIAVIPRRWQLTALSVDFDRLAQGASATMNVGTTTQQTAFISSINVLQSGVAVMGAAGSSARTKDSAVEIVISFSGSFTFIPNTAIRLVAQAVYMPTFQEVPL